MCHYFFVYLLSGCKIKLKSLSGHIVSLPKNEKCDTIKRSNIKILYRYICYFGDKERKRVMVMTEFKNGKAERILGIYTKLINGSYVNKSAEAVKYNVTERSIQRDIESIRGYIRSNATETDNTRAITYKALHKGYCLENISDFMFSDREVLAISKILLASRAFSKAQMASIINKLINGCVAEVNRPCIRELLNTEIYNYTEPNHSTSFMDNMWKISGAIKSCNYIEIDYYRISDKTFVKYKLKPVAVMFSEYYFYMVGLLDNKTVYRNFDFINDSSPTIYRIDRIRKLRLLDEKFDTPYTDCFQEDEFRKRIQFMYSGKLKTVRFEYFGNDISTILDRLPTAKILIERKDSTIIETEVYGNGIDMWLRSQGNLVKVID